MKKYVCLIALIGICSCKKTGPVETADPENISANYSYVDIEYRIDEHNVAEDIVKEGDPLVINNNTAEIQTYVFKPQNNIYERSGFGSMDAKAFAFVDEGQKIKIPIAVSDDGDITLDDGTRWYYLSGDQKLRPAVPLHDTEITIPPGHRLTLVPTFTMSGLSANYELYLKGVEFGETITVEGWWAGTFFVDCSIDYSVGPIEMP